MTPTPSPNRRTFLSGVAAIATAVATGGAGATDRAGQWPRIAPPVLPRIPHAIRQLGRVRDDPYAWIRYIPKTGSRTRETLPPMIARAIAAEADYAAKVLAPLAADRADLLAAMRARSGDGIAAPPLPSGPWLYASRVPAGQSHVVHYRIGADGREQVLLDEGARAKGHSYYRTTGHQPSPDHRYFAWAEDIVGNDRHRLCILDTRTGQVTIPVATDAYGYGGLTFAPSSTWLFWIWRDARNRPTRLYRTPVEGGAAVLVYEESDPAIFMAVARTAADGFVRLTLSGPSTGEVRLIGGGSGETAPARLVRARRDGVSYDIDEWAGGLVMLTNEGGAFDRKVLKLDRTTMADGATLVPHRPGTPIVALLPFAGGLVRLERIDGLHRLVVQTTDGRERPVVFDGVAYAIELVGGQDYRAGSVRIVQESPVQPRRWIDVTLSTGAMREVAAERLRDFDPDRYAVERLTATTADGTAVPITLVSRKDMPRDGSTPLLLYGYGAYGIASDPVFSLPVTVLIDRGWRYAIAHVRGGSERGQRWFEGGRRFTKRNSMTDFVTCGEALCNLGYSTAGRVVAYGLSAGGLLVGGAMNLAPTLWAGVIAKVPFVDMLNTMSDADHPLVPLFRPDWGDPLSDPRAYDNIASISPYENVHSAPYPPLLCTAGLKDDRVAYWEPAKLVAEVRHRSTSGNPAVLVLDENAGHQSSGNRDAEFSESALFWAFAIRYSQS
ncbi:prolyl oligopeptidase family serine peptidase [Sphingomonas hankookensis]|uniref:prolyl oligopeptidase family serine peptidase n=1 Tax=Sphingomonas hankookensis TaxID=563996 RepID=UPI001F576B22|nr:prolyl oligopeptidase family serine peptidase [Sphingomonas hankookensis]